MTQISINTTQNVNINFEAASIGERILGGLIDFIIKIAYATAISLLLYKVLEFDDVIRDMDRWSQMTLTVIFYIPIFIYSLVLESLLDGQTIGKLIMKTQVVKIDGYQASLPDYFVRWLLRLVDINLFVGVVGIITIVSSSCSHIT